MTAVPPDQSGDAAAQRERFERVFRAHYPELLRFAAARVDGDAARDAVADTFLVAWRRLAQMPDPPRPWLYGVLRGSLANQLCAGRRRDHLHARLTSIRQQPLTPTPVQDPDAPVLRAFASLSHRDQLTLRLIEWDELDTATAAAVAGFSTSTFTVRLHRARRRLTAALAALTPSAPITTQETR